MDFMVIIDEHQEMSVSLHYHSTLQKELTQKIRKKMYGTMQGEDIFDC